MSSKYIFLIAAALGLGTASAYAGLADPSQKNNVDKQAHVATAPSGQQASRGLY